MNAAPLRRPLGCLKTALRHARQQHQPQQRTYANAIFKAPAHIPPAAPTPTPRFFAIKNRAHNVHNPDSKKYRTGFAVYTAPNQGQRGDQLRVTHPHLTHPPTNPVVAHHAYQINKMDPSGARTRLFSKLNPDSARVGDILLVTTRRSVEPFGGVLIAIRRRGIETAILLRGQLTKIGTEMWYKVYSRNVTGIEIIKRAVKRARRARLNYLRQPKHDIGSVDNLVREWKRNKNVFASKGGKRKKTKKMMF